MNLIVAAIRSGTDPVGTLPPATFHRWLEDPVTCPRCEASYTLVVDYDRAIGRHFASESRRHLAMLRKAIVEGHGTGHQITHFETNGVVVTPYARRQRVLPEPVSNLKNASKNLIN